MPCLGECTNERRWSSNNREVSDNCWDTKWQKAEAKRNELLDGMEAARKEGNGKNSREQRTGLTVCLLCPHMRWPFLMWLLLPDNEHVDLLCGRRMGMG